MYDDLVALKSDYPENYLWDMTRSYTSKELGTATGVEAFAYMLSDKVFGAMAASKLKDPCGPAGGRRGQLRLRQRLRRGGLCGPE